MKKYFFLVGVVVVIGLSAWILAAIQEYKQSYEQKLVGALDAVEATINAAVNSVDYIGLHSPALVYSEADDLWIVTGIAVLRGVSMLCHTD